MSSQPTKKPSRLRRELAASADYLRSIDGLDAASHARITTRAVEQDAPSTAVWPLTADDIRALREREKVSQAVFARHLNVTVDYVAQLERGAKRPSGTALALLNVIRRKGIDVFF